MTATSPVSPTIPVSPASDSGASGADDASPKGAPPKITSPRTNPFAQNPWHKPPEVKAPEPKAVGHSEGGSGLPKLPNATENASLPYNRPVEQSLRENYPPLRTPREYAHDKASEYLHSKGITENPDNVYYIQRNGPADTPKRGPSMTDIMMRNEQDLHGDGGSVSWQSDGDGFAVYAKGSYYDKDGKPLQGPAGQYEAVYDETGHLIQPKKVNVSVDEYKQFVWNADIYTHYNKELNNYLDKNTEALTTQARGVYLYSANKQVNERSISQEGYRLAMRAAGVPETTRWDTLQPDDLKQSHGPDSQVEVRPLGLGEGATSNNAQVITDKKTGHTLLYLPGNSSPLHEFQSGQQMQQWIVDQVRDPSQRQHFLDYFSIDARKEIAGGSPAVDLDTFLAGVAETPPKYSSEGLVRNTDPIQRDIFQESTDQLKQRLQRDLADTVTSDRAWTLERTGEILSTVGLFGAIAAPFVPESWVFMAGVGLTQVGVGAAQIADHGATQEGDSGAKNIVFGFFNAVAGKFPEGEGLHAPTDNLEPPVIHTPEENPSIATAPEDPVPSNSPANLPTPEKVDENQLILHDDGVYYGRDGGQYIKIDGKFYQARDVKNSNSPPYWELVDSQNPNAFYGGTPVRRNPDGTWEVMERPGLRGGAPWVRPLDQQRPSTADIEMSEEEIAIYKHGTQLRSSLRPGDPQWLAYLQTPEGRRFLELEKRANNWKEMAAGYRPPPRNQVPLEPLDPNASDKTIIDSVSRNSNITIIGERHSESAARKFFVDNAEHLHDKGYRVHFIEGYDSTYQPSIDKYLRTGIMDDRLRVKIDSDDAHWARESSGSFDPRYSDMKMFEKAREYGIRIVGNEPPVRVGGPDESFNYYAMLKVEETMRQYPAGTKVTIQAGGAHMTGAGYGGGSRMFGLQQMLPGNPRSVLYVSFVGPTSGPRLVSTNASYEPPGSRLIFHPDITVRVPRSRQ
jgi:hypothetical protein